MDLLIMAGLSLVSGIVLLCMGLSFISQNLNAADYGAGYLDTSNYYKNPLYTLNSKYWHYRPRGSVVVSKQEWEKIEKNIGIKISEAKTAGSILGYKGALIDIRDKVAEEKAKTSPSSPYLVLGVDPTTPLDEIEKRYNKLMDLYALKNFVDLDMTFTELATIRNTQILRAWNKIKFGIGRKSVSGGQY